jgi:hypothetical protein
MPRDRNTNIIPIPPGIIFTYPVTGDAIINSYRLINKSLKGPYMLIDNCFEPFLRQIKGLRIFYKEEEYMVIDWIHSEVPLVSQILEKIDYIPPEPTKIQELLTSYININEKLDKKWVENTQTLILNTQR